MPVQHILRPRVAYLVLVIQFFVILGGFAQGTAFTYQGHLNSGTNAANGAYDLKFGLYDSSSGGNLIAGPLTNTATTVSAGLFAVVLDFGSGAFTGPARWLDISVRTNGNGAFTTLTPRQQITAAAYAIFASSADAANSAKAANTASNVAWVNLTGVPTNLGPYSAGAGLALAGNTFSVASQGVANSMLSPQAVTVDKISPAGASAGAALIYNGSSVTWSAPGGLPLPFSATISNALPAFAITNTAGPATGGTAGGAIIGKSFSPQSYPLLTNLAGPYWTNANPQNAGVVGVNDGELGYGVAGISMQIGPGVGGVSFAGAGVYGNSGAGPGVSGLSSFSSGVFGSSSTTNATTNYFSNGTNVLRLLGPPPYGVWGNNPMSGNAGGLGGTAGAVGIGASPTNTALEVNTGSIKITGAGTNTPTAAFIFMPGASNWMTKEYIICEEGTNKLGEEETYCMYEYVIFAVFDHPLLNGNPSAMVFVTPRPTLTGGPDGYAGAPTFYSATTINYAVNPGNTWAAHEELGWVPVYDDGHLGFAPNHWVMLAPLGSGSQSENLGGPSPSGFDDADLTADFEYGPPDPGPPDLSPFVNHYSWSVLVLIP